MSATLEEDISFSRSIFALLAYYGSGNIQTVFSAIDKALAYAQLKLSTAQLTSTRRLLFNRLILFGILEYRLVRAQRRWCFGPNRLVRLPNGLTIPLAWISTEGDLPNTAADFGAMR